MRPNMGVVDRLVRALVLGPALTALGLALFGPGEVLGIVALVLGSIMFVTAVVGFCPAYVPFGIDTRRGARTTPPPRVVTPMPQPGESSRLKRAS